jgi:hypothetical protein
LTTRCWGAYSEKRRNTLRRKKLLKRILRGYPLKKKRYKILKQIMLTFLTLQDQVDLFIEPKDDATLEFDGGTIWMIKDGKRHESIQIPFAIEHYLNIGAIEEIL